MSIVSLIILATQVHPIFRDRDLIDGDWTVDRFVVGDFCFFQRKPDDIIGKSKWVIKGSKLVELFYTPPLVSYIKLDPMSMPKRIDIETLTMYRRSSFAGIYRLNPNQLTVAVASSGDPPPKDFVERKGSSVIIVRLSRDKR